MAEGTRLRISVLTEMLDRARAVDPDRPAAVTLAEAFGRGVELLEAQSERLARELRRPLEPGVDPLVDRARFDVLRHRAFVLSEQNRALEEEVYALAVESRELHERIWPLQERTTRLKVGLGRRQAATLRPEPPLEIGLGGSGKRRPDPAERLLAGLAREEIELDLPPELLERAEVLARRHGWHSDWGDDAPLVVLAHGLAALELERRDDATAERPALPPAIDALRYRIFTLGESLRIMAIRETALRIDNQGMRMRVDQLERELSGLEQEWAERPDIRDGGSKGGWLGRLFGRSPDQ